MDTGGAFALPVLVWKFVQVQSFGMRDEFCRCDFMQALFKVKVV